MIEQSLWRSVEAPRFTRPLPKEVDVVIVGGGITGLSAALLLKRSGRRVAVFERDSIGGGETASTSAHLTCVTDTRPSELEKHFGAGAAKLVWRGGQLAIDLIEANAKGGIACGFQRVPGYLCAPFVGEWDDEAERESLRADEDVVATAGFAACYAGVGPITGRPAAAFANQALFHPLDYVVGLAISVDGDGSVVRDQSEVGAVIQDPLAVIVNGENIVTRDLVIATHVPIVGTRNLASATLFQTKLYPYSTYVFGARVDDESLAPGLHFDTSNPYYYLRVHERSGGRYVIFGGGDHKTGQASDTEACFEQVRRVLLDLIPSAAIERRWSGQVIETDDGLPFIGEVAEHQYVATGFGGNGLTFGTLAGMIICDEIAGIQNPWRDLFHPGRKPSTVSAVRRLIAENIDYPSHYVGDRLREADGSGVENVPRGAGKVITLDGRRVAVHRTDDGEVIKVDAMCTHMGCIVRWNTAERTWDCPCHGSRFSPEGQVVGGPAEAPLGRIEQESAKG